MKMSLMVDKISADTAEELNRKPALSLSDLYDLFMFYFYIIKNVFKMLMCVV